MLTPQATSARAIRIAATCALLMCAARVTQAQTTSQIPLEFDFLTPGARSMAMGGAFIGAADDATAAFTNPAGLAWLTRREVSAEGRFRRAVTPFLSGGRISGLISGQGLDVIPSAVYQDDVDRSAAPAFGSILLPTSIGTFTVYAHQMAKSENTFFSTGVFERFTFGGVTTDNGRELPVSGTRSVDIVTGGVTFGRALTDRVAIGGGLSLAHLSLDASFARNGIASLFGPVLPNVQIATAVQSGHDFAPSFNAGVLMKATDTVRVGASFRRGPRFTFTQDDRVFDAGTDLVRTGSFKVPDVFGAGVAWQAAAAWRVLVDYDFVHYSQLKQDFIDFQAISSNRQDQVVVDNGHEIHAGVEYLWLRPDHVPLAFRAGWWRDPAHTPRYVSTPQHDEQDVLFLATLPGASSLSHYTFGAGVATSDWFELNGAADLSSRTTYVTLSAVFRFRRGV